MHMASYPLCLNPVCAKLWRKAKHWSQHCSYSCAVSYGTLAEDGRLEATERWLWPVWPFPAVVDGNVDIDEMDVVLELHDKGTFDAWHILELRRSADQNFDYGDTMWGPNGATLDYWVMGKHMKGANHHACDECGRWGHIHDIWGPATKKYFGCGRKNPEAGGTPLINPWRPRRCDLCRGIKCRDCMWWSDEFSEEVTLCKNCLQLLWSWTYHALSRDILTGLPVVSFHFRASALPWNE